MKRLIVLGDTSSHGGEVVTASPNTFAGPKGSEKACARIGDVLNCPIHGPNPIVEGSGKLTMNRKKAAREGDKAQCGATLVAGHSLSTDGG